MNKFLNFCFGVILGLILAFIFQTVFAYQTGGGIDEVEKIDGDLVIEKGLVLKRITPGHLHPGYFTIFIDMQGDLSIMNEQGNITRLLDLPNPN